MNHPTISYSKAYYKISQSVLIPDMNDQFWSKKFSDIGILSYLKGREPSQIVAKFKEEAAKMDSRRKHEIRQKILSSDKFHGTQSLSGRLKVQHDRQTYVYQDELAAACLETCKNYHEFHIKFIAETISRQGNFGCQECGIVCQSTSEIILNAFVASYFQKIKNYEGSTLILKKKAIGSMFYAEKENQATQTQQKTLVASKDREGQYYIIQLKVLQIDNNDKRVREGLNTQKIAEQIQRISRENKSKLYEERQLQNTTNHYLINLLCFKSSVRIRNPLIHKLCKPQDHKNRLILYSYEQIYSMLFVEKKKKTIRCIYHPFCPNYFDEKNFAQMAIIVQNIKKQIYEQYKECMYGEYFSGLYQQNWHYNYAYNTLLKNEKNRQLLKRYLSEIRINVQEILTYVSLAAKRKVYKEIKDCIENQKQLDPSIKLSPLDKQDKIIIADIGDSNLCPVRCTNCKNLDSLDAYRISFIYMSSTQKNCPICTKVGKKKSFYDNFYLDLQLMEFLFLHGHNKQVYYDTRNKTYFHKLSFFTGRSIREKLKQQNKVSKGYLYQGDMDVKLSKNIRYVPLIDRRCLQKAPHSQYNKHIIYVNENEKLKEDTYCPHCKRLVRSDQLEFNEELQSKLRASNNQLRWGASAQNEDTTFNASIASIKYYNDIKSEFSIKSDRKTIKFYWKNYEGTLIRYPFKFKGCAHHLQTAICDFSDILYQSKVEKQTQFRCRYKQCDKKYTFAQQLQRVSLDIYSKIEQNPQTLRKIIKNNQYWIQFNIDDSTISKTSKNFYDGQANEKRQQEMVEKYRNKYVDNMQETNRKELTQNLRRVQEEITYTQQRIRQDERQYKIDESYKHSQNAEEFQALKENISKLNLKKKRLQEQKQHLFRKEMEENRKNNKTNSINFTKLMKMYQPQVNKLKEKRYEEDNFEDQEPEDYSQFKTYGNLFPFKYAVPKTTKVIDLKELEKIVEIKK